MILAATMVAPRPSLLAQTTDQIDATIQFNFSNPGARSLALGGAFTARADDATAVYANPAGLVQLFDTEVSLDFRAWEYSSQFLDRGLQAAPGSFEGLEYGETADRVSGLSFASAIYPGKSGRWVAGVFVHQLANFEARVESGLAMIARSGGGPPIPVRPIFSFYDLEVGSVGLSAAYRLSRYLSVGATVTAASLDLRSRTERDDNRPENDGLSYDERDLEVCCFLASRDQIIDIERQDSAGSDDDDVSFNLGLLWQSPARREGVAVLTVGTVYRRGPEFGFLGDSFIRTSGRQDGGLIRTYPSRTTFAGCTAQGCPGRFKVPDVLGLGVSARPSARWVIALDLNRVRYSQLIESTLDLLNAESTLEFGESGPAPDFELDDGTEIRLGIERGVFRRRRLPDLYLRAGLWHDPDHETRYVGDDEELRALWAPGSAEMHYSLGLGGRFRHLQFDAALDVSDRVTTMSLSSVYYFRD